MAKLKHLTKVVLIVFIVFLIYQVNAKNKEIEQLNLLIKKEKYIVEQSQKLLAEIQKKVSKQENEIKNLQQQYKEIKKKRFLTQDDIEVLERIVEAEASNQDLKGRLLVANVVLNRLVERNKGTVRDIVFSKGQFSPVSNGLYYKVSVSEKTKKAVDMALKQDYSKGSLYFLNPKTSSRGNVNWFRNKLTPTITTNDHHFYK